MKKGAGCGVLVSACDAELRRAALLCHWWPKLPGQWQSPALKLLNWGGALESEAGNIARRGVRNLAGRCIVFRSSSYLIGELCIGTPQPDPPVGLT